MPRSYWLPIVAAVGLVLANPEVGYGQGNGGGGHSTSHFKSGPKPEQASQPILPTTIHSDIQRVAAALEAGNQNNETPSDKRNAAAQEKIADWTPWFWGLAFIEAITTGAGVVLVYFTLMYTRRTLRDQKLATKAAWAAAKETKRSAKAAEEALTDTRKHTNLHLRPWIAVSVKNAGEIEFTPKGMHTYFEISLKNVGAFPAMGLKLRAELKNWRSVGEDAVRQYYASEAMKADETAEYGLVLLPNEVAVEKRGMSIFREDFGTGFEGKTHLSPLLLISVMYRSETIAAGWAQTAKTIFVSDVGDSDGGRAILMESGDIPEERVSLRENGLYSRAS